MNSAGGAIVVEGAYIVTVGLVIGLTLVANVLILEPRRESELRQGLEVGMYIRADVVAAPVSEVAIELIDKVEALILEA